MARSYALLHALPGQSRYRVAVRGPDAVRFLQGTLTCDMENLDDRRAAVGALLTVKGKLVTEVLALRAPSSEGADLLVPEDQLDTFCDLLERHIIMDDVVMERDGPVGLALCLDPEARPPKDDIRAYVTRHPAPGLLLLGTREAVEAATADGVIVSAADWDQYRVQTESPAWGAELRPDFFPPELGFNHAVSYDKGCYMGQEPLARIHARGQVNRVMIRVDVSKSVDVPHPLRHEERGEMGILTTAVMAEGVGHGLAIVRRSVATPGTVLVGEDASVVVRSGPLGDANGIRSTADHS